MNSLVIPQLKKSFLLCVALGIFLVPTFAQAFFSDTETSPQQQFQASELQLDTALSQSAIILRESQPSASTTLEIDTSAQSVPIGFDVAVTKVSGDIDFCDNIQLQANSGVVSAQAALPAFTTSEQTTLGAYELTFSLIGAGDLTVGKVCTATIAVTAWQQNMSKTTGYRDVIEYQVQITAADVAVQRLAASVPVVPPSEVAGASTALSEESKDSPEDSVKKEAKPVDKTADDTAAPSDPTKQANLESSDVDSRPSDNEDSTANGSDPVPSADKSKSTTDPTEPSPESVDKVHPKTKPKPPIEPVEPSDQEAEVKPLKESLSEEVVVSAAKTTKEEDKSSTKQLAAKQPESAPELESDVETQTELEPDPEPTAPPVAQPDDAPSEPARQPATPVTTKEEETSE